MKFNDILHPRRPMHQELVTLLKDMATTTKGWKLKQDIINIKREAIGLSQIDFKKPQDFNKILDGDRETLSGKGKKKPVAEEATANTQIDDLGL